MGDVELEPEFKDIAPHLRAEANLSPPSQAGRLHAMAEHVDRLLADLERTEAERDWQVYVAKGYYDQAAEYRRALVEAAVPLEALYLVYGAEDDPTWAPETKDGVVRGLTAVRDALGVEKRGSTS